MGITLSSLHVISAAAVSSGREVLPLLQHLVCPMGETGFHELLQHGLFPGAAVFHGLLQPRFLSTGCSPAGAACSSLGAPLDPESCQPSCSSVGSFLQSFLPGACSSMAFPFLEKPLLEPPGHLAMQTKHKWRGAAFLVEAFTIRVTAETAAWQMESSVIVSYMGTPGLQTPITSPSVAKGLSHTEALRVCTSEKYTVKALMHGVRNIFVFRKISFDIFETYMEPLVTTVGTCSCLSF